MQHLPDEEPYEVKPENVGEDEPEVVEGEVVNDDQVEERGSVYDDIPPGHPEHWTQGEWLEYDNALTYLSMDEWHDVEKVVFNRPCDDPDCDGEDHAAAWWPSTSYEPSESRKPDTGSDRLPAIDDDYDAWEEWWYGKDVGEMTGDELEQFNKLVNATPALPSKASGTKDEKKKENPPKGSPCFKECRGPGYYDAHPDDTSKQKEFTTHLERCPQHPKYDPTKDYSKYTAGPSCKHDRDEFVLEDGLSILASAYRDVKYLDNEKFDVGVYMYDSWQGGIMATAGLDVPWKGHETLKQVIIDWPDFGIPDDDVPIVTVVKWMLDEMKNGTRFETGCMGGHGRTGTMLACLLAAQGVKPGTAIERVREHHCDRAIENEKQAKYVAAFYEAIHGASTWVDDETEWALFNKVMKEGHKQSYGNYSTGSGGGWGGYKPSAAIYDHEQKIWTCKTWRSGMTWDKDLQTYVSEDEPPD